MDGIRASCAGRRIRLFSTAIQRLARPFPRRCAVPCAQLNAVPPDIYTASPGSAGMIIRLYDNVSAPPAYICKNLFLVDIHS